MTQMSVLEINPGGPKFEIVDAAARAAATGPLVASTAAGMTDTSKVYVYTGSETGYENGHWYYYDGSAWQDGGVYNSSAINVDDELSDVSENPVQNKVVTAALDEKANIDGEYEQMTVGNAEQLVTTVGVDDETPYLFRTAGGSVDVGDRKTIDKIVGGTVAWNQLVPDNVTSLNKANVSVSQTDRVVEITSSTDTSGVKMLFLGNAKAGHKYLISGQASTSNTDYYSTIGLYSSTYASLGFVKGETTNLVYGATIVAADANTNVFGMRHRNAAPQGTTAQFKNACIFDLTQMFGSTIADYIYSLEQATAGAGVAFFKNLFPNPYYPYDAGSLKSVGGLQSNDTIGFNQFDKNMANITANKYLKNDGTVESNNSWSYSDYIPVIGGATYYSAVQDGAYPSICWYDANKNYISGETFYTIYGRGGTFTPSADARYIRVSFPTAKLNEVCINLSWDGSRNGEYEAYKKRSYALDSTVVLRGIPKVTNGKLSYDGDEYLPDGTVNRRYGIRAYQSGDESLADAITDGTNTVYKLATPTTETAEPYQAVEVIDDFGTEQFVATVPTDGVVVPVGHSTFYPINLKAKLEMAPNSPSSEGDFLVRQTDGENEYVPVASNSAIAGLLARCPELSGEDGTYVLKATKSGSTVTYSWVAE